MKIIIPGVRFNSKCCNLSQGGGRGGEGEGGPQLRLPPPFFAAKKEEEEEEKEEEGEGEETRLIIA